MSLLSKNNIPVFRKSVQAVYALFCIYTGIEFYRFYLWASGGNQYIARPPAVEAFLPISALMSLKRLLITGKWDMVHPAGLAIFLAVLASALLFRRGFCGYVCPVGLLSDLLEKTGKTVHINLGIPPLVRYPMLCIKYLLLGFFAWIIVAKMDVQAIEYFLHAPYNITVDARMLMFFLEPTVMAAGVMAGIAAISIIIKHYWCTYCCPYGALLGIIALVSPLHVKRDETSCQMCHKCQNACPANIQIWNMKRVRVPECIGCMECLAACPEAHCLELGTLFAKKRLKWWIIPAGTVATLLAAWIVAKLTGHWHSAIDDLQFRQFYAIFLKS